MQILLKKFGDVLTSRQAGREAYAAFLPTLSDVADQEAVIVDFAGVQVLSPSWADEFLTPLLGRFGKHLHLSESSNLSINLTIVTIEEILGQKFALAHSKTSSKSLDS